MGVAGTGPAAPCCGYKWCCGAPDTDAHWLGETLTEVDGTNCDEHNDKDGVDRAAVFKPCIRILLGIRPAQSLAFIRAERVSEESVVAHALGSKPSWRTKGCVGS